MQLKTQPPIHFVTSPSSLNFSLQRWYNIVVADSQKSGGGSALSHSWVDVRDTALGHVLALEKDAAGGQRIITAAGALHVALIISVIFTYIDIGGFLWQEWSMFTNSIS